MPGTVDEILAAGHDLADQYREACGELNRHWPDEAGVCLGCGDPYPCAEEWITLRAVAGIERRWRREGRRLAELHEQAAAVAADNQGNGDTE